MDTPHFPFLGSAVLVALFCGLAAAFVSIAISSLLIRVLFISPELSLQFANPGDAERMGLFVLVSLMIACLVAAVRRQRDALRESEERFRTYAENTPEAVVLIDEQGLVRFANAFAERLLGTPVGQMLGRPLDSFLPGTASQQPLAALDRKVRCDGLARWAFELPSSLEAGKNRLVELTLSAFRRPRQALFTAVLREITSLRADDALVA